MTIGPAPVCYDCEHLITTDGIDTGKCKAFPKRIPDKIFWDLDPHNKPFPGDNGIQFKLKKGHEMPAFLGIEGGGT